MNAEEQAAAVGENRKALRRELNFAKSCLLREYRGAFKESRFDFENKRLIGDGYFLQWKTREHPEEPESYDNQQTTVGIVQLYRSEVTA